MLTFIHSFLFSLIALLGIGFVLVAASIILSVLILLTVVALAIVGFKDSYTTWKNRK